MSEAAAARQASFRIIDMGGLAGAAAIYGAIFPVNRLAAEAGWPPAAFAFLQALVAGVALAAVALARGERLINAPRDLVAYGVIGGLVLGLPIGILVAAAPHLDASVLTLVLCLSPIFTLIIGSLIGLERFRWTTLAGMALGTAGVALIATPGAGVIGAGSAVWFLIALIAPVMFASANNCAKWLRPEGASALTMAIGTLLGGAVVALIVALALAGGFAPAAWDIRAGAALGLAAAIDAAFFLLFFVLVGRLGPARFSLFNYLAVAAGVLWSLAAFGEQPARLFWIALALMVAGMAVSMKQDSA